MFDSRDNEYQDPTAPGSLSAALSLWQAVRAGQQESVPKHLAFTLSCPSEARADRVAGHLRRRVGCTTTSVRPRPDTDRSAWQVRGSTRLEIQSLTSLEHLLTWLRRSAGRHQVDLVHLALVEAAA